MITDRHVAEANIEQGLSGSEAIKIASLSSGARGLLVAMVCYGVSETLLVTKTGGPSMDCGRLSMNMSEISKSFTTMLDVKKKSGGIQIGHESTDMNIQNWIYELHSCGLIKGGENSRGGLRSFSGGRSDKV